MMMMCEDDVLHDHHEPGVEDWIKCRCSKSEEGENDGKEERRT